MKAFLSILCVILFVGMLGFAEVRTTIADSDKAKEETLYLELFQSLRKGADRPIQTGLQGSILDNPELEALCWDELERNVVAARKVRQLTIEIVTIDRKLEQILGPPGQPDHPNWAKRKELLQAQADAKAAIDKAKRSKERLNGILHALRRTKDARAVRLIAPIINEEHFKGDEFLDYREESVPVFAMLMLQEMANAGIFQLPVPAGSKLEQWRTWWEERGKDFGAVYELPKAHPDPVPEQDARNVLALPTSVAPLDKVANAKEELPASGSGDNGIWYWVIPAVCVALIAGLFATFRRKA